MAAAMSLDEFVADAGYPGYSGLDSDSPPWLNDPYSPFRAEDQSRSWFLDFHWPRGLTPMGLIGIADGYAQATQRAADGLSLPSGGGIAVRTAGTHIYATEIPLDPTANNAGRAARFACAVRDFVGDFERIWRDRCMDISADWQRLRRAECAYMSRSQLADYLRQARAHQRRAWEIHFELMYPLLANYIAFRGLCTELGVDVAEIGKFLGGHDTRIMETDRQLWRLAASARNAGLDDLFRGTEPEGLKTALIRAGGRAGEWLSEFGNFLDTYGWRTDGINDIALPSWVEDPTSPLGFIKTFLQQKTPHDFTAARIAAVEARDTAIDAARSMITREEQNAFDAALACCQAANFAWWNEEHNYYIDLRATLPLRWGCLAVAEAAGADQPDDTLFLFWPEMMSILDGDNSLARFRSIITDRRQYFTHWRDRRATMPKVLGCAPDAVSDPILAEILGLDRHLLRAMRCAGSDAAVKTLTGIPAAPGMARGRARVLRSAADLYRVQGGDVLVCESTSPNWAPAFGKIAGCVCDAGGSLSHAAIVGREYGVPTVTATGLATAMIQDGDDVEVDGSGGTVTIHRQQTGKAT